MNWAQLPVAGGIYAQRPDLLDDFLVIWQAKGAEDRKEAAKKPKPTRGSSRRK